MRGFRFICAVLSVSALVFSTDVVLSPITSPASAGGFLSKLKRKQRTPTEEPTVRPLAYDIEVSSEHDDIIAATDEAAINYPPVVYERLPPNPALQSETTRGGVASASTSQHVQGGAAAGTINVSATSGGVARQLPPEDTVAAEEGAAAQRREIIYEKLPAQKPGWVPLTAEEEAVLRSTKRN